MSSTIMVLQHSCNTGRGVKGFCREKDVRNSIKFHLAFFPSISPFSFIFSPTVPFSENTVPQCSSVRNNTCLEPAGTGGQEEQPVTAGIPPCHLRRRRNAMGLGRTEPEPAMLKSEVQGHEVLKTDHGRWNSGHCGRSDNRSICLFEGMTYIVMQKKVRLN